MKNFANGIALPRLNPRIPNDRSTFQQIRFLLLSVFFVLTIPFHVEGQTLLNDIRAYWKLDGNATDDPGTNDGTVYGATSQSGKIGNAYQFDGSNDYIEFPHSSSISISGSISISAWIYITGNPGDNQWILGKPPSSSSHTFPYASYVLGVNIQSGSMYPIIGIAANNDLHVLYSTQSVSPGQWYHIVGVYDGANLKMYINSVQRGSLSQTGSIMTYSTPARIGTNGGLSEIFYGKIDEVGLWGRALTQDEINQLYNGGTGSSYPFSGGATVPVLTTSSITGINQTTAEGGGNITSDGGASVTARGVCWSTTTNPTTSNSKTTDGSGTGTFPSSLTGLTNQTTYYVRAYATNSVGTAYGNEVSFTTGSAGSAWQTSGANVYYNSGNVGIGTASSFNAKLNVNGKILAEEVEVISNIASDFVFDPDYTLMPISELEEYLKTYRHLPEIPSADEFAREGQNLGEMDDLLLRKIEQLTLYIIRLQERISELENR